MNKYHNRKITRDGRTFDSVKEYRRFCELSLLEKAGKIKDLKCQVKFVLIPAQRELKENGQKGKVIERECAYYADFTYWKDGRYFVEDAKGMRTEAYRIKRKLMLQVHGIKILEV